jgi:hypothetical protein
MRSPSQPTFFTKALHSDRDQSNVVSLPFRLNVESLHDKIHRSVPYLRQSWGRIDFVAISSFWITFALAKFGFERGSHHIGVFRAMSVLRTARLLAISSGTTVSAYFMESSDRTNPRIFLFIADHNALAQNSEAAPHECRLLCSFRYGIVFVSQLFLVIIFFV